MKLVALILALAAFGFQTPDESNLPESEKRIPPGHYCKKSGVPLAPSETKAHSCDCQFSCTVGADGTIVEHEDQTCQAFCHVNGRHCTCHVEEPCPEHKGGNALMDMDGNIVAMRSRR